jgi:hypothetical protein
MIMKRFVFGNAYLWLSLVVCAAQGGGVIISGDIELSAIFGGVGTSPILVNSFQISVDQ